MLKYPKIFSTCFSHKITFFSSFLLELFLFRLNLLVFFSILFLILGLLIYLPYGRSHSVMAQPKYEPLLEENNDDNDEKKSVKNGEKSDYGTGGEVS